MCAYDSVWENSWWFEGETMIKKRPHFFSSSSSSSSSILPEYSVLCVKLLGGTDAVIGTDEEIL